MGSRATTDNVHVPCTPLANVLIRADTELMSRIIATGGPERIQPVSDTATGAARLRTTWATSRVHCLPDTVLPVPPS